MVLLTTLYEHGRDCESLKCTFTCFEWTCGSCDSPSLLYGSLDKSIKVWGETESGNIEQVYKHDVDDGVLAFCGINDAEEKPIMLCSCKDNGVYLYDLPSFVERGRIFSKWDIQAIQIGTEGMFFTGDAAGLVRVWKPNGEPCANSVYDRLNAFVRLSSYFTLE